MLKIDKNKKKHLLESLDMKHSEMRLVSIRWFAINKEYKISNRHHIRYYAHTYLHT